MAGLARKLRYIMDVNGVLSMAGYQCSRDGAYLKNRDLRCVDRAIKYGVPVDEFADAILRRDGFRQPMTTAQVSTRWVS